MDYPARILIVDDDADHLEIFQWRLRQSGCQCEVEVATSGEECLRKMEEGAFDCVVSDYEMPEGMNGIELMRTLKQVYIDVPVIVVTSHASDRLEKEARGCGADGFISKQVGLQHFESITESIRSAVLKCRSRRDELIESTEQLNLVELVVKADGITLAAAEGALSEILHLDKAALVGKALPSAVCPEDRTAMSHMIFQIFAGRQTSRRISMLSGRGRKVALHMLGRPVFEGGKIIAARLRARKI